MQKRDKKTPASKRPDLDKGKQTFLKVDRAMPLLEFLQAALPGKRRSALVSLLKHRQVSVDLRPVTQFNHPLKVGQQVVVTRAKVLQGTRIKKGLNVVFEDPYLVVVDKHSGLLSIATDAEKERTAYRMVSDLVKGVDPRNRIFVVHRLDREVSGLMLFAKSKQVQETLQGSWSKDVLERRYVAVVEGVVEQDQGTITSWLKENAARVVYSSHTPNDGYKAVTHYRVLKRSATHTLLEVTLETGRKNQIRVHMQELGHSVVGDDKYGATGGNPLHRLGLHARVLAFRHPVHGESLRFETPIPARFLRLFKPA